MNRVRRLAEELVDRYPNLFSGDFDKNKEALAQVTVIRTRSLRNQLAGAITKIIHKRGPVETEVENIPPSLEEKAEIRDVSTVSGQEPPKAQTSQSAEEMGNKTSLPETSAQTLATSSQNVSMQ